MRRFESEHALAPSTLAARGGAIAGDPYGATSAPLYQTATFAQSSSNAFDEFDYSRTDNPTRRALEQLLAGLEGAEYAWAFASGMAAVAATLRTARPGERIVFSRDLYGGTQRFAQGHLPGVESIYIDLQDLAALDAELAGGDVRLVFFETPSNPRLEIVDVRAVARIAHAHGVLVAVDATAMTPHLMRPLELGADIVLHSATKGLGGHGDVTAGVVLSRCADAFADVPAQIAARRNAEGSALAPFDAWLLMRGVRTLGARVAAAQTSALVLAEWLTESTGFGRVHYPGLASHRCADVHAEQASGGGILITLECETEAAARSLVENTRLFTTAVSFGGVASSISLPHYMSHASTPVGAAPRPSARLVRLSIGLEDVQDLKRDLKRASLAIPVVCPA